MNRIYIVLIVLFLGNNISFTAFTQEKLLPDNKTETLEKSIADENNTDKEKDNDKDKDKIDKIRVTDEQKNLIKSVEISTNQDLKLWLHNLGLPLQGIRAEYEQRIFDYYEISSEMIQSLSPKEASNDKKEETSEDASSVKNLDDKKEETSEDASSVEKLDDKKKATSEDTSSVKNLDDKKEATSEDASSVKNLDDKKEATSEDTSSVKNLDDKKEALENDSENNTEIVKGTANEIIIKNTDTAQYFTYEKINENIFNLKGAIEIWIVQASQNQIHVITADSLIYNETLRIGTALGNVQYKVFAHSGTDIPNVLSGNPLEKFSGKLLSFNIDDFDADILEGTAYSSQNVTYGENKEKSEELSFYIYSPHISKSKEDVVVISDASITSNEIYPPLYTIKLKRMWLLAPNEWAISRASIFIGNIPVIWFPFFVNPGDKFFFHPGIGYKTRNGGYFNTTTYIIGEHDEKESDSFLDIFDIGSQTSNKKIIKGLYLREAEDGDVIKEYPDNWKLRYLLDYYTTLGVYSALEGEFSSLWKFNNVTFKGGIALSQTVFKTNDTYFNNYVDANGSIVKNIDRGVIYNVRVPFRYEFLFKTDMAFSDIYTTSLFFEQYSDSFFESDFGQRTFDFNWDQVLNPDTFKEDFDSRPSEKSNYYWQWRNNLTLPIKSVLGNYVENFRISNILFNVEWNRKNIEEALHPKAYLLGDNNVDQKIEGYFFVPSEITLPSYQFGMSGTLLSLDTAELNLSNGWENTIWKKKKDETNKKSNDTVLEESKENNSTDAVADSNSSEVKVDAEDDKNATDIAEEKNIENDIVQGDKKSEDDVPKENNDANTLTVDTIVQPFMTQKTNSNSNNDLIQQQANTKIRSDIVAPEETFKIAQKPIIDWTRITYNITYDINHILVQSMFLNNEEWNIPEDMTFFEDNFISYGLFTTNNTFELLQDLTFLDSMIIYRYGLDFTLNKREVNTINTLTEQEKESQEKSAINYTSEVLHNKHELSIHPFKMFPIFSGSTVSYTVDFDIGRDVLSTKSPAAWYEQDDKNWWNSHVISQSYSAKYAGVVNTLGLSIGLPPLDMHFSPSYALSVGSYFNFEINTQIQKNEENNEENNDEYIFSPLSLRSTFSFFENQLSISQSVNYNYKDAHVDDTRTTIKIWWVSLALSSLYEQDYILDMDSFDFKKIGEKKLRVKTLDISANYTTEKIQFWKNRVNFMFDIQTMYQHNFLQFLDSQFRLTYKLSFEIYQLFTFSLSASIRNDLVFLYNDDYTKQLGIPTRNLWDDIVDGFALADQERLKKSAFKLDKLSLNLAQDFGGWILNLTYSGYPKRTVVDSQMRFKWENVLEIGVFWKPIADINATTYYQNDTWSLEKEDY